METQLDARGQSQNQRQSQIQSQIQIQSQGQFPASFPDTFKNFFALMNEDEDHVELFANLLEDKIIPPRETHQMHSQHPRSGDGSMRRGSRGSPRHGPSQAQSHQQSHRQQQQHAVTAARRAEGTPGSAGTAGGSGAAGAAVATGRAAIGETVEAGVGRAGALKISRSHSARAVGTGVVGTGAGAGAAAVGVSRSHSVRAGAGRAGLGTGSGALAAAVPIGRSQSARMNRSQRDLHNSSKGKTSDETSSSDLGVCQGLGLGLGLGRHSCTESPGSSSSSSNLPCKNSEYCCLHQHQLQPKKTPRIPEIPKKTDIPKTPKINKKPTHSHTYTQTQTLTHTETQTESAELQGDVLQEMRLGHHVQFRDSDQFWDIDRNRNRRLNQQLEQHLRFEPDGIEAQSGDRGASQYLARMLPEGARERIEPRHSKYLERMFDFDNSCDENESSRNDIEILITSLPRPVTSPGPVPSLEAETDLAPTPEPVPSPAPPKPAALQPPCIVLKPILKQTRPQQQLQQQQPKMDKQHQTLQEREQQLLLDQAEEQRMQLRMQKQQQQKLQMQQEQQLQELLMKEDEHHQQLQQQQQQLAYAHEQEQLKLQQTQQNERHALLIHQQEETNHLLQLIEEEKQLLLQQEQQPIQQPIQQHHHHQRHDHDFHGPHSSPLRPRHRLLPTPPTQDIVDSYNSRDIAIQRAQLQSLRSSVYGNPNSSCDSSAVAFDNGFMVSSQTQQQPYSGRGINYTLSTWVQGDFDEFERNWNMEMGSAEPATRVRYGSFLNDSVASASRHSQLRAQIAPQLNQHNPQLSQLSPQMHRRRSSTTVTDLLNSDPTYSGSIPAASYSGTNTVVGYSGANTASGYSGANIAPGYSGGNTAPGYSGPNIAPGYSGANTAPGYSGANIAPGCSGANIVPNYSGVSTAPVGDEDYPRTSSRHRSTSYIRECKSPLGWGGGENGGGGGGVCGVLTFQQAMSGAVSPQYANSSGGTSDKDRRLLKSSNTTLANETTTTTNGMDATSIDDLLGQANYTSDNLPHIQVIPPTPYNSLRRERGVGESSSGATGASTNPQTRASNPSSYNNYPIQGQGSFYSCEPELQRQFYSHVPQLQRQRTYSMPAENQRKPRLADTRRAAIHCSPDVEEFYRQRKFSITSQGITNLGDSLRTRRSRSVSTVTYPGINGHNRNTSSDNNNNNNKKKKNSPLKNLKQQYGPKQRTVLGMNGEEIPSYKVAMLGAHGVGKTTLTYQFTTSDYSSAYDLSMDEDYGQKCVSMVVDNVETDLEIIDHPACEMSTEAFCATYSVDIFVVVYSVEDKNSLKCAEETLRYLKDNDMLLTKGAILVGNKTDMQRRRVVKEEDGLHLAKQIECKFVETSAGLTHKVDELLVGIVAQAQLNPQRIKYLNDSELQRLKLETSMYAQLNKRDLVRQHNMCQEDEHENDPVDLEPRTQQVRKDKQQSISLGNILKLGESELEEDEEELQRGSGNRTGQRRSISKFEMLTKEIKRRMSKQNAALDDEAPSTSAAAAAAARRAIDDNVDSDGKVVSRLTIKTKALVNSLMRFKRTLRRRRKSKSCDDLFVI